MSSESPPVARFADVTPGKRKCPSWLAKSDTGPDVHPPRPGALPREFLAAFQREIESASELPPAALAPSIPPHKDVAAQDAVAAELSRAHELASILPPPPVPASEPASALDADPEVVEALLGAVEQVMQARADVLARTANQLAELAVMIARRVIARELSISAAVVHDLIAEGLDALGAHDRITVRLGEGFAELRDEVQARLLRNGAACEVRLDGNLGAWGCVVETELGSVDESVEARLATLLQALKPDSSPPE